MKTEELTPKDYPVANKGIKVGIVYRFQCILRHKHLST